MTGGLGNDTLDMAAITANITVNLGANNGHGSASSVQSGTDTLYNIENVVTGSGADTITASNGVNVMDGGAGTDTFVFTSATAADGDTILGFEAGDKVDLSGIDAKDATGANDSFTLVSGAASGAAGSLVLTYETRDAGEFTVLEGHVNGTGEPEFRLSIAGHVTGADITL
jgi:Ca2+-binding RTX toxin-like protein